MTSTYYIHPVWFYLTHLSQGFGTAFTILGILSAIVAVALFIGLMIDAAIDGEIKKNVKKATIIIGICAIVTIFLSVALPDKQTCIEMMVASQVTHENVEAVKEEVYEIVDYVTEKVKGN